MGHKSKVRIATTREGYDLMCDRVDFISGGLPGDPLMGSTRQPDVFEEKNGCVLFGWNDIDWCVGLYCNVTNVVEALNELDEQEIPYEYYSINKSLDVFEFYASGKTPDLALRTSPPWP